MADACLRNRVHYPDITGEIDVFEALAARDAEAKAQGVTLSLRRRAERLPCRTSEAQTPDATHLKL
jgi:saccharopine dehydrogenase (NAD+, L-lysine-forming)